MSYARPGFEGSEVYVYQDTAGFLACSGCLFDVNRNYRTHSRLEMIDHLIAHQKAGQVVPPAALDDLSDELLVYGDEVE